MSAEPARTGLLARLGTARGGALIAALAVALLAPALFVGESVDDHFHRAVLRPEGSVPLAASRWGMFAFLDADAARTRALTERGVFPWWTGARTQIAFVRPLAEITHRGDYALWPHRAGAMHAQSLAWAAVLFLAVGALYRRFLGPGAAAGLATLLYALDDAHGLPIAWIANRNAVLSASFGVLALVAHDRWRRGGVRAAAFAAPGLFLASLLSSEGGIGTLAYLAAHALVLDGARGRRRLVALVPYAALVVAWRAVSERLGYGVRGSGLYIDPLRDPARFVAALVARAPVLLAGQWGPIPSDLDGLVPERLRVAEVVCCTAALALLAWVLAPRLRGNPMARFFAVGMLLSLLPVSATFPSDRLLFFVGLGAMGLLALVLPELLARGAGAGARALGWTLVVFHLVLAPVLLTARAYTPALAERYVSRCMRLPDDPAIESRRVILLNALDACAAYVPVLAALDGRPAPRAAFVLATGVAPVTLTRDAPRALRVRREDGWFSTTNERVFWDPAQRWTVGQVRDLDGMRAEVVDVTADGRPREVRFRFDTELEDPSLRWLRADHGGLAPLVVPAVGSCPTTLPRAYP